MEFQIKKAVKAGNSSAVILPRAWLNKDVRIELLKKTPEMILIEIIHIIKKHILLKDIIGIYLSGSYAREEEDKNSDIDVLIVTNDINKEIINEGIYTIITISLESLKKKLKEDLLPIGQMIKESKPLLNSSFLNSLEIKVTKNNVKWHIDTTKDKIELIGKIIDKLKKNKKIYVNDKIAYTLILRIRTLYIIKKLIENKNYLKKEFQEMIRKVTGGINNYERYLAVKNDLENEDKASLEEIEKLHKYLAKQLLEIKKLIEKRQFKK